MRSPGSSHVSRVAHSNTVSPGSRPPAGAPHASRVTVRTVTRDAWGAPAGGREPGETVLECATRETWEEPGLRIDPARLRPCGYERVTLEGGPTGRWPHQRNYIACFATVLEDVRPAVAPRGMDVDAAEWVHRQEVEIRCREEFWWPLFAHVHSA